MTTTMTDEMEPPRESASPGSSILIVDDEATARDLCADVAREAGLLVRTATTTEQALEILEQYPVDIVLTDLKVPALGGIEFLKRVRASHAQVPVLVLTQYGTIETAVEATRLGAADYVTKPFHVDELRSKLDRLLHAIELTRKTVYCANNCAAAWVSAASSASPPKCSACTK